MTTTLHDAAEEFLALRRIAVAGVSRDAKQPALHLDHLGYFLTGR